MVPLLAEKGAMLWLDSSSVNAAIVTAFKSSCHRHEKERKSRKKVGEKEAPWDKPKTRGPRVENGAPNAVYNVSPVTLANSVKNEAEIEGMKNSHLRYLASRWSKYFAAGISTAASECSMNFGVARECVAS